MFGLVFHRGILIDPSLKGTSCSELWIQIKCLLLLEPKLSNVKTKHSEIFPPWSRVFIDVTFEVRRSERPREVRPRASLLPSVSMPDGGPLDGKPPVLPAPPPPAPVPPAAPLLLLRVWVPLRIPPLRLPRELRLKSDDLKWRYGRALNVGVGEAEPAV